jgi:hypothetical protein
LAALRWIGWPEQGRKRTWNQAHSDTSNNRCHGTPDWLPHC